MDEIKNNAALEAEEQEESLILKFRRPYPFEGQEYTELDLSGLENVTAGTLENIGKIMAKKSPGLNLPPSKWKWVTVNCWRPG